jgi:hypothetical protein
VEVLAVRPRRCRSNRQPSPVWSAFVVLLIALGVMPSVAQQPTAKTQQLKAVFLLRLAQFIEWPADAFAAPQSPLVIGVLGENPFGEALQLAVSGETARGRKIELRTFTHVQLVSGCHVLYISEGQSDRIEAITRALRGRAVLTVSDADSILRQGGMVRFLTDGDKVNLRIDLAAVKSERLTVDARLLRIAEVSRVR